MSLSARTPGAKPRLLAVLVTLLAVVILVPWLSSTQWRGQGVAAVMAVRDGRPFGQPERAGYLILGMAADTILPTPTSRDLNLLGVLGGVLATLAVARFRSVLARGGAPIDRLLEPLAAALALLSVGPLLARMPSADAVSIEVLLAAVAAALAWTGRLPSGLLVFGALLFVSSRSLVALPILLAAPRLRGDLRSGFLALGPWIVYALVLRPGFVTPGDPAAERNLAGEALALLVGYGGVIVMAAIGAGVGIARGGPHRRYVLGVLATLVAVVFLLAPRAGWVEASLLLAPWLAVLAGSGVGSLRRAASRVTRVSLGPIGAALGVALLGFNLALAVRHGAGPVWRQANRFPQFATNLGQSLAGPLELAADWDHGMLYGLVTDFRRKPWPELASGPFPDRPLDGERRAALDAAIRERSAVLLRRFRYAMVLPKSPAGVAQILNPETRPAIGQLARFGEALVLEQVDTVLPIGRRPGGLLSVRVHWRATWPAGALPPGPEGHPARSLRVAMSVVDAGGQVRLDLTHWLAHGLLDLSELGGRRFNDILIFQLPFDWDAGDYGIEIAVYEPGSAAATGLDLELGPVGQHRLPVRIGANPPGVTPGSVRAASFRLQPSAPPPAR